MTELEAFTGFGIAIVCLIRANGSHSACVVVPVPTKSVVTKAMKSLRSSNESLPACESYLPSRDESGVSLCPAQIALIQDIHSQSEHRKIRRTHHQRQLQVIAISHFGCAAPYSTQFSFLRTHSIPPQYPEQPRVSFVMNRHLLQRKGEEGFFPNREGDVVEACVNFCSPTKPGFHPDSSRGRRLAPSHSVRHETKAFERCKAILMLRSFGGFRVSNEHLATVSHVACIGLDGQYCKIRFLRPLLDVPM
jgi:hypothetical protein